MSQDYRQVALVSDGSSGIGAATVRRLAAAGWDVSFCHRGDEQAVRQVEKAVSELGGRVLAVEVDVTDAADVASWFQQAQDELGPVQAAVSCAGLTRDQPLARLAEADWRAVLDTGLDGMFHICRAAMLAMMKRRSGRIVAVSSVCGAYDHSATHDQPARPWPAHQVPAHHWPVRAGMTGFVPALSALTSRFGVSVNAVTPGPAAHDMTAILPELTRADLTETVALRRFDDASDVADLVTFLLSAACDITGRVLELRRPISLLTPARSPRDRIKRTKATARSANNYAERTVALRSGLRSSPGLRSLPNGLGGGLDELGHLVGVGDHRHVAGRDLDRGGAHALGEQPFGSRRDGLVVRGDQEPGRQGLPGRDTHHVLQGGGGQRLLDRVHDLGLDRVDVAGEVLQEVVLADPGEAELVDVEMGQRRGRRAGLSEQPADRFALVKPEGRDVDEPHDVRRVGTEGGHDLAAVGMAGQDGGAILAVEHLAQPGDISGERGLGELGRRDVVAVGLQALATVNIGPCGGSGSRRRSGSEVRPPRRPAAPPPRRPAAPPPRRSGPGTHPGNRQITSLTCLKRRIREPLPADLAGTVNPSAGPGRLG